MTSFPSASHTRRLNWPGPPRLVGEKLAQLPEDEAKALRAKAAEASRISKARKRGTTPEQAAVTRLEARLAKINEEQEALNARRQEVEEQLEAARIALSAVEKKAAFDA